MTKQEFYRQLCIEQGTLDHPDMSADEWYRRCSHNITPGMDEDFALAATGDVQAIIDVRQSVGLPILA